MKSLIALTLILSAQIGHADHYDNKPVLDCRVTKMVDYTYFEEGLSKDEYPDVEVNQSPTGEYTTQFGSHAPNEKSEGDKVTFKREQHKGTVVSVLTSHGDLITIEVEYRRTMALGKVAVKESGKSRSRVLAHIVCDKGF